MIGIRTATVNDFAYLDALQKEHRTELSFFSMESIASYVFRERVVLGSLNDAPAGYLLGTPSKVASPGFGAIYQAAVQYDARHRDLGVSMVDAFVAKLAPQQTGLELWCASDLEANDFWKFCGFTPVAFRAGSVARKRVHLLWRKCLDAARSVYTCPLPTEATSGHTRRAEPVIPIAPSRPWQSIEWSDLPERVRQSKVHNFPRPARDLKQSLLPGPVRGLLIGGSVRASRFIK